MQQQGQQTTQLKPARPTDQWAVLTERLHQHCTPPELIPTDDDGQPDTQGVIGQDRAVNALRFGLAMKDGGFNIFVVGAPGSRRFATARACVEEAVRHRSAPRDWCYVYNFDDPYYPSAIELDAGGGQQFGQRMDDLVQTVRRQIAEAFETDDYRERREEISREQHHQRQEIIERLSSLARERGFSLSTTAVGIATVPLVDNRPMSDEEFAQLPNERKEELSRQVEALRQKLERALAEIQSGEQQEQNRVAELDREVAEYVVGPLINALVETYPDALAVREYLQRVHEDLVRHVDRFRKTEPEESALNNALVRQIEDSESDAYFDRYHVNVIISNASQKTAPIVVEPNPTYYNLFGRLEYHARFGTATTSFRMIKPGSLHRANGGYLIVNALNVLQNPFVWEALKRSLRTNEIAIENLGDQFSAAPVASLRPTTVPLDVKVILVGTPQVYYLLYFHDEEFRKLFKVKADFDTVIERTPERIQQYARFIRFEARRQGAPPFDPDAIAAIVDHGTRAAQHQHKLTAQMDDIADLTGEAGLEASAASSPTTQRTHVDRAIAARNERASMVQTKVEDLIDEGMLFISTQGHRTGQVNGLSIISLGDHEFGLPVRITAQAAIGADGIVNVERETRMAGPIHNKGFLIISGYLLGKYAQEKPLALSARITFEQTYDEIDGDSASSAEIYALLSNLAGVPLRQDVAVTGSVDQRGRIQSVGGVTRKVEGFFDVCQRRGLTGEQGVIIPEPNVQNLVLRADVVQAVKEGKFRIWAIRQIDDGIEILTGIAAGQRQADGKWESETIHGRVSQKLDVYGSRLRTFGRLTRATPPSVSAPVPIAADSHPPRVRMIFAQVRRVIARLWEI